MYCSNCRKEVVIISIGHAAASEDELGGLRREAEQAGQLILFNPAPFGPRNCPACHSQLTDTRREEEPT